MNLSNTMFQIKVDLGLLNISTPFEDLDGTIIQILQKITIPKFSVYSPFKDKMTINLNDLEVLEHGGTYDVYLLPEFNNRKLLYVFDIKYDAAVLSGMGYYGGGMPLLSGDLVSQVMMANAGANMMGTIIPKLTFEYLAPRKVVIYNAYSSSRVVFELGFQHDPSLASIKETTRESFLELAKLDVMASLYPTLKHYTEINSSIGNINLKLDDFANAADKRENLLSRWDDTYHLDFKPQYWI